MESTRSPYIKHLYICVNKRDPGVTCCSHGGGEAIREKLKAYVKENGLKGKVRVSGSGCMDLCAKGPNVMVYPDYRWYRGVTLSDVDAIIEKELAPLVHEIASAPSTKPVLSLPKGSGRTDRGSSGRTESVRAFLFDLGNVLVRFDHGKAAQQIAAATGASADELYQLFFVSPLVVDHDEGRISTRDFYEALKGQIDLQASYEEFLPVWNNIFTEDVQAMNLARDLMGQYPCFLISNTNRPHFEYCRKEYPILNRFSGWVLSYEVGVLKPHPAIYQRALEMMRLPPSQVLYIDDREDLVEAGRQLGFQTHRFVNAQSLQEELTSKGILRAPSEISRGRA